MATQASTMEVMKLVIEQERVITGVREAARHLLLHFLFHLSSQAMRSMRSMRCPRPNAQTQQCLEAVMWAGELPGGARGVLASVIRDVRDRDAGQVG